MPTPRILFNPKDHPTLNSGYGIVARYLLPLLGDHYGRENVIIYAPVYQKDAQGEWDGMLVLAADRPGYGEELVYDHYTRYGCNLLIIIGDVWPLGIVPDLAAEDKVLWVSWCAVDWLGMPKNVLYRIKPAHKLVPFSKYGEAALRRAGLPNVSPAIWLGLNTDLWKPAPPVDEVMYLLGYKPDSFNILMVAANQERKEIRSSLEAVAMLRKIKPDVDVRMYLHTRLLGDRDIRADEDELGLRGIIQYPDPYLVTQGGASEADMVKVFNAADVVVNPCMEGFGYAVLQAQAVGCPAIVLSEGASPELTVFGVEVPPQSTTVTPHQMAQPHPSPIAIAQALCEIWDRKVAVGGPPRSQAAVDFVQQNFSWPKIAEQWCQVIDQCMEDRVRHCMDIPEPAPWLMEKAIHWEMV